MLLQMFDSYLHFSHGTIPINPIIAVQLQHLKDQGAAVWTRVNPKVTDSVWNDVPAARRHVAPRGACTCMCLRRHTLHDVNKWCTLSTKKPLLHPERSTRAVCSESGCHDLERHRKRQRGDIHKGRRAGGLVSPVSIKQLRRHTAVFMGAAARRRKQSL